MESGAGRTGDADGEAGNLARVLPQLLQQQLAPGREGDASCDTRAGTKGVRVAAQRTRGARAREGEGNPCDADSRVRRAPSAASCTMSSDGGLRTPVVSCVARPRRRKMVMLGTCVLRARMGATSTASANAARKTTVFGCSIRGAEGFGVEAVGKKRWLLRPPPPPPDKHTRTHACEQRLCSIAPIHTASATRSG